MWPKRSLSKNWIVSSICHAHSSFPISHLRKDSGDDPSILVSAFSFKWKPFRLFSFVNQSEVPVSNGNSMWGCNCQCPPFACQPPGVFACERTENDDASAELIPKLPFVSITLAPAAMRLRDTDMWTIDDFFIYLFWNLDNPDLGVHWPTSLFCFVFLYKGLQLVWNIFFLIFNRN